MYIKGGCKILVHIQNTKYSVYYKNEYFGEVCLLVRRTGRANTANTDMYTVNHPSTIPLILNIYGVHILGWVLVLPNNLTSGCVQAKNSISMSGCYAWSTAVYPAYAGVGPRVFYN